MNVIEETAAIASRLAEVPGLEAVYDHEPQQIGKTPVVTVLFAGIQPVESANLRQAKQLRLYDVRLYVSLEGDWAGAQIVMKKTLIDLWDVVVSLKRLDDPDSVIIQHVHETKTEFIVDDQQKRYVLGTIRLETEHRSAY